MKSTAAAGLAIQTYLNRIPLAHPEYREAIFSFRPKFRGGEVLDWRWSDMTIELISSEDSVPEIHFFGPVERWSEDQWRNWTRLKNDVFFLPTFDINRIFDQAVIDLTM